VRPLGTIWTAVSRPLLEKQNFKLLHRRPLDYLPKNMDMQSIKWFNSEFGVKVNEMSVDALTVYTENP